MGRFAILRLFVPALLVFGSLGLAGSPLAFAQEEEEREATPGPGSEESPAFVALPVPLLRPPAGLEFVPDSPASRASLHLHRAAAIWPLVEHLAAAGLSRFVSGPRGPVRPDRGRCAEAEAIRRLLEVAQVEFEREHKTGMALLESARSGGEAVDVLRALGTKGVRSLKDLGPRVRTLVRQTKRWGCVEHGLTGLDGLKLSATSAALAGRPLLVESARPSVVLWLDGVPVGVSGQQSWGLILLEREGQVLCQSDARKTSCRGGQPIGEVTSAYLRFRSD